MRMDLRWAGGDINRIGALAEELVGLHPTSSRQAGPRGDAHRMYPAARRPAPGRRAGAGFAGGDAAATAAARPRGGEPPPPAAATRAKTLHAMARRRLNPNFFKPMPAVCTR